MSEARRAQINPSGSISGLPLIESEEEARRVHHKHGLFLVNATFSWESSDDFATATTRDHATRFGAPTAA